MHKGSQSTREIYRSPGADQYTMKKSKSNFKLTIIAFILFHCFIYDYNFAIYQQVGKSFMFGSILSINSAFGVEASVIRNSDFKVQELDLIGNEQPISIHQYKFYQKFPTPKTNQMLFDAPTGSIASLDSSLIQVEHPGRTVVIRMPSPVEPFIDNGMTENDADSDLLEKQLEKKALGEILSASNILPINDQQVIDQGADVNGVSKSNTGNLVDFELTPASGHNKAKFMKKKKNKKEKAYKKWGEKKITEKNALDLEHKEHMKKKKAEGSNGKKKWSKEEQGMKKKDKYKKKNWGKKLKKGKGLKKGSKGNKFLKDVGHKDTGFKTVYHKEEYGKSSKWHDVKREKKWNDKDKKWKKNWNKENGKKYKDDHLKKVEKKEDAGKKYKDENKEKYKKFKKEKFEKGKKKKMEELRKKKEEGAKEMKEIKKKKKKTMNFY